MEHLVGTSGPVIKSKTYNFGIEGGDLELNCSFDALVSKKITWHLPNEKEMVKIISIENCDFLILHINYLYELVYTFRENVFSTLMGCLKFENWKKLKILVNTSALCNLKAVQTQHQPR